MNPSPSSASDSVLLEGRARIPFDTSDGVFYNKVQVFNRDLSIVVINCFNQLRSQEQESLKEKDKEQGIKIFEALSATGLRSIRYALEIPNIHSILVNDLDPNAVESIKKNILYNDLSLSQFQPNQGDANFVLHSHRANGQLYDVIDLDPYGSAAEFLDASITTINEGGLLCVTCTDKAVLAGNHGETCFAKYGAYSIRGRFCHELAVRILLFSIAQAAGRHRKFIVPLISLSIDFYVRVFVRVYSSAVKVKHTAAKMASVFACNQCDSYWLQRIGRVQERGNSIHFLPGQGPPIGPSCSIFDGPLRVGGPMWAENIHETAFVNRALDFVNENEGKFATFQRIIGTLLLARDELPHPLYLTLSGICHTLHITQPKLPLIRSALLNGGYQISQAHSCPDALKTNAPLSFIWDIFRAYAKDHPFNEKNVPQASPARKILATPPAAAIDFTLVAETDLRSRSTGVAKFLPNPEAYWGPKARAKKRKTDEEGEMMNEAGNPIEGSARVEKAIKSMEEELAMRSKSRQGKKRKKTVDAKECHKFTHTGSCPFGDKCKYKHLTASEREKQSQEAAVSEEVSNEQIVSESV
jgi:tRNA (guanine26-N2/guanine27-N2)-dimethyltransferase